MILNVYLSLSQLQLKSITLRRDVGCLLWLLDSRGVVDGCVFVVVVGRLPVFCVAVLGCALNGIRLELDGRCD